MSEKDYGVPQPPELKKSWVFKKAQKLGMPLLFLIPLLAILGVFGNSIATVREQGEVLDLELTYPTKLRLKTIGPVIVRTTNLSSQTVPTVTVKFDQDYLSAFSNVAFQPAADEITEEAYYVYLNQVEPGETRIISVEVQGEDYWRREGTIVGAVGGSDAPPDAVIDVSTFVFP